MNVPPARHALLLASLAAAGCGASSPPDLGPPVLHEAVALDIVEAFAARSPKLTVVAQDEEQPLAAVPFSLDKAAALAADGVHKVIHARAESAFEVRLPPLPRGARLQARTFVYSVFRNEPERADPAPVDFRILVDGQERAALSSDYITRPEGRKHPYDILLRTLDVPLDEAAARGCTLRFETTRRGAAVPAGVVPAEPLWWDLRVLQPVPVPRQAAGTRAPNLLLLVVDTLAGGRTSLMGHGRDTTPRLSAFAARGTSFTRAIAPSSWTLPSTATLLTGLPPNTHGVLGEERSYLMDGLATWPERLQREGLLGAAFVANPLLAAANNFTQGFAHWEQADADGSGETAAQMNARLLAWLDGQPRGARWFAWVHYMDPHAPYAAPGAARLRFSGPYVERRDFQHLLPIDVQMQRIPELAADEKEHLGDLYDAEVAWFDECFGALLDELARRGLLDSTVIAVTADHGEELFEHGQLGHGYSLHDELLHVPLVLAGPRVPAARVESTVGTASLAATLLQLGGAQAPELGPSLLERPRGAPPPVFSAVRTELFAPRHVLLAAQDGDRKVVLVLDEHGQPAETLRYDLRRDPGEQHPVDPASLSEADRASWDGLARQAVEWDSRSAAARPPEEQPEDPDFLERLKQIDYVGGGGDGH